ncbi:hypothetical protein ACFX5K_06175 [Rickettsiales bacterium LUAb2]
MIDKLKQQLIIKATQLLTEKLTKLGYTNKKINCDNFNNISSFDYSVNEELDLKQKSNSFALLFVLSEDQCIYPQGFYLEESLRLYYKNQIHNKLEHNFNKRVRPFAYVTLDASDIRFLDFDIIFKTYKDLVHKDIFASNITVSSIIKSLFL